MSDTARRFTHDRGGPSTRPPTERGGDGMTHKEMSVRLRVLADCPTLTVENRAELDRIANELAPPRPEPGTVVWFKYHPDVPWSIGVVVDYGIVPTDHPNACWDWGHDGLEWKPAYVAPPDSDSGTEALIDELRNRIAELEDALYYVMDDFEKWPGDISKASWDKAKEVMREAEALEAGR